VSWPPTEVTFDTFGVRGVDMLKNFHERFQLLTGDAAEGGCNRLLHFGIEELVIHFT